MTVNSEEITTLVELLVRRSATDPDRVGYVYDSTPEETLTHGELHLRASMIAQRLNETVAPGERALLLYPAGLEFLCALFGCFYAGVIAVPVASPSSGRIARHLPALEAIAADCEPAAVLTTAPVMEMADEVITSWASFGAPEWIASDRLRHLKDVPWRPQPVSPTSLAFLQYTSGSTSSPKGVMLTHANVISNIRAGNQATQQQHDSVCVLWLPHFHDMGLGAMLSCLYIDYKCVFMSPTEFAMRPLRWLHAISKYRATLTGGPNIAFDLCAQRVGLSDIEQLDLSSLQTAANGAEPVRWDTVERFATAFAPAGFRREAMMPCYGLAESVVFVTGTAGRDRPRVRYVDAQALRDGSVRRTGADDPNGQALVSCGQPSDGHDVVIVDPNTLRRRSDDAIGEIWLRGPSVVTGYWNRPEESLEVFRARLADDGDGPYLRTGDLGFVSDGELFVCGRMKDLIIIAGANHFPQDIERTVEACHPRLRLGAVAAFSVDVGYERLVVIAQARNEDEAAAEIIGAIRAAVAEVHGLKVEGVGLVRARALPRTSSGKIRRQSCREMWLSHDPRIVVRWETPDLAQASPQLPVQNGKPAIDEAQAVQARVLRHVAALLKTVPEAIEPGQPLVGLGLGSLELAELKASLDSDLRTSVPLSGLMKGWSAREVAAFVEHDASELADAGKPQPEEAGASRYERLVNPAIGGILRRLRLDKTFVSGQGVWLFDSAGRRYLDAVAGYGSVPLGHSSEEIWAAVRVVGASGEPCFVQPSVLEPAAELAERLIDIAPDGLRYVAYANSGAEAVEAAIKLVRAATGRPGILSTDNGFHGKTLGALSATGKRSYQDPFEAPVPGFERVPFGDVDALADALDRRSGQLAAFIVEPIQGEGGIVEPPPGYLLAARELCTRYDVKLIVDEIQTGLGRTGSMFACDHDGVSPDVLVLAKALGGGVVPMAAVLYGADCYSDDFALKHTSTFAPNSLGCRVGLAVLDRLTADGEALVSHVETTGKYLASRLQGLRDLAPSVLRSVRGRGLLLGLELETLDTHRCLLGVMAAQERLGTVLASHLLEVEQLRVAPTLFASNVVRIEPPLTISMEQCDQLVAGLRRALVAIERRDTAAIVAHLMPEPRPVSARRVIDAPRHRAVRRPGPEEGRWAFLAHPIDSAAYRDFDESMRMFSAADLDGITASWRGLVEPFVAGTASVRSPIGADAYGEFIIVPFTTEELSTMHRASALGHVRSAVSLARERGAEVVGLGGHLSIVAGAGVDIDNPGVHLTTGNGFTAVATMNTARQAFTALERHPAAVTVAVVGATGSVGRAASLLFAEEVGRLILVGNPAHPEHSERVLELVTTRIVTSLRESLRGSRPPLGPIASRVGDLEGCAPQVIVNRLVEEGLLTLTTSTDKFLPMADLVVTATSTWSRILRPEHFKLGAIACDVSRPFNVAYSVELERPDVLVIDGGLVDTPPGTHADTDLFLPSGSAFACMCEPMMLALERHYNDVSIGVDVRRDHLLLLQDWQNRHGFRVSQPRSFGRLLTEEDWERARAALRGRSVGAAPMARTVEGALTADDHHTLTVRRPGAPGART